MSVISPERSKSWSELADLIDKLLDTPPHARDALIERMSEGSDARRDELEALLAECEREPYLLSVPAADRFASLFEGERRFPDALAERYMVTRELGRGGMATVYLARDVKHNRDVAVKVVLPIVANTLGADRFLREIEMVAQLRHPHIVPLFDSGEADGALYYVMPYEAGLSLRERLREEHMIPPDQVVGILRDICDALAYAHAQGIVHRDIKPDNVLLSGNHALVTDFGIAKAARDASLRATGSRVVLGTPAYMAPEQVLGDEKTDHRVDIYAVGALGYELLAGHPPFTDARRNRFLAVLRETPTPLTKRLPGISAALSDVVMRCLQRKPSDRWQTADELLKQLESLSVSMRSATESRRRRRWTRIAASAAVVAGIAAVSAIAWRKSHENLSWRNRWSKMHIEKITDFPGAEVDAAISRNGQFAAFLSDRDSVFDAFVTRIGSGQFTNLTHGRFGQLFNEDVRNIGFTPAGDVWIRVADLNSPASVSLLSPSGEGPARPFLKTAVMAAWSPDGSRLAFHETTPGDPIFVANADGTNSRRIFIATSGLHSHHLTWSPDGRFIYFTHGLPPDEMDIWRIPSTGGGPERVTGHNSRVGYPVFLDNRTMLYTATADDGTGPWLYMMDLDNRFPLRLSTGVEHFTSIATSADVAGQARRLVATVSNPSVELWSIPLTNGISAEESASRLSLPTARAAAPRFTRDASLLYLASRGGADGLWRLSRANASELWKPSDEAIVGAAAESPDGTRICFVVRREQRSTLRCAHADGSDVMTMDDSLDVRGAPSWSPDSRWIAIAARDGQAQHVWKIPVPAGASQRLIDSVSSNPVWSPDGRFILYSGTPRGRSVPLNAVTPDGKPHALPFSSLLVDRLGDSYRFLPGGKSIVIKLGGFRSQDFWLLDVTTGKRRQLTRFRPGQSLLRFDVSPDGKRIVFERVRENSDVALIEVPAAR